MPQNPTPELPLTEYPTGQTTGSQYNTPAQPPSQTQNGAPPSSSSNKPFGRRRKAPPTPTTSTSKPAHLNSAGKIYAKLLTYGTGTRYSIYILPISLILIIPIIVGATQVSSTPSRDPKIGGVRVVWFFTWIEAVWLTFWVMKLVARLLPGVFGFFAGVVSSETKRYVRVLENLRDVVTVVGWVAVSFVLYEVLFSTSAAGNTPLGWTSVFKKVLGALLVASIIFLIEKVLVQLVSVSYHARSFNERIRESKRFVFLLGVMFEASRKMFPLYGRTFLEEDYEIHNSLEGFVRRGKMEESRHRVVRGLGRVNKEVQSVFGHIGKEVRGRVDIPGRSAESMVSEALDRKSATKMLAQRLWLSFVMEGNEVLHQSDIEEVLGEENQEVAEECFLMLDPDENGDVSLEEMTLKVKEISSDRKAISRSMHDVSQAIKALDNVLASVAFLLSIFALISFLDTGFHSILSTTSTALLSLSFVFSATAQEFLGSCIFLFVKHPYDISDRVDISGPDGVNRMVVDQISLLYTSFRRITDLELIQIPNSVLNTLWINNITRSRGLLERIDINISFDTSFEDINALRLEMQKFVSAPENKREWQEDILLRCLSVGCMDKLQLQLEVRHKNIRASRHSKMMCALVLALRKIPIFGPGGGGAPLGDPSNPSYNVAVSDDVAAAARDRASRAADAARMSPLNPEKQKAERSRLSTVEEADATGKDMPGPASETMAADAMNAIRLGESLDDPAEDEGNEKLELTTVSSRSAVLPEASNIQNSNSVRLQKTKSPQGRRRAGSIAPSNITTTSRQDLEHLEPVSSYGEA